METAGGTSKSGTYKTAQGFTRGIEGHEMKL